MANRSELLLWSPRILGILVCVFLSVFALDAFEGGKTGVLFLVSWVHHRRPRVHA